jgi:hypothetical protein
MKASRILIDQQSERQRCSVFRLSGTAIGIAFARNKNGQHCVFAAAVDYDAVLPFPVVGLVQVLGSWVWLEGPDIA